MVSTVHSQVVLKIEESVHFALPTVRGRLRFLETMPHAALEVIWEIE